MNWILVLMLKSIAYSLHAGHEAPHNLACPRCMASSRLFVMALEYAPE